MQISYKNTPAIFIYPFVVWSLDIATWKWNVVVWNWVCCLELSLLFANPPTISILEFSLLFAVSHLLELRRCCLELRRVLFLEAESVLLRGIKYAVLFLHLLEAGELFGGSSIAVWSIIQLDFELFTSRFLQNVWFTIIAF
jgi:hypothetical protein